VVNRTGTPSKSSSMKAIAKVHSEDRTLELANILGMTLEQWLVALTLKEKVSKHERWFNERSPHCLMIDCIYLIGKYTKNKNVKQTTIQKITKQMWGLSTTTRPSKWKMRFKEEIQEAFDALDTNNVGNVET
tara:strand:+ start:699 stop:1094 length:396 start_codon:yes stop_codon:yes gene_type:complete